MSYKNFFCLLLADLERCGYVVRFNLLDAVNYGVPQRRLRVFIEGARSDLNVVPKFPSPTHFDLESKSPNEVVPLPLVAVKCFAVNGFEKNEINDVWFNSKLNILMNRKTAAANIEQAVRDILLEEIASSKKSILVA